MLKVTNLTKRFKSRKRHQVVEAVKNISFEARSGEIFGLLGPNGAGKTTTIRLIATILQPTSGTAEVAGFDIRKESSKVRERVGVLTTDVGLYDRFSGRENLRYYGQLYGLRASKLEDRINELAKLLEMGDFIDRRSGKYSTGMRQKIAIARSIIHDPEVVIFDEPTAGLDVLAAQTVIKFMQKAKGLDKLVILSTHRLPDAERLCDRVAIMHLGEILTIDTVQHLKDKTGTDDLEDAFLEMVNARSAQESLDSSPGQILKKPKLLNLRPKTLFRIIVVIAAITWLIIQFLVLK